ncbi:tRNA1(Val) (adenine(37)-N6)-methyltransferase [Anaerosalibacter massiliensis]|uniref:tRNA1(Val) (adenine(37)-N6)-methyltransferase n=1 Tax=Anaerosalibacter massiliensis TaxID=1347392 RepID=UPI0005B2661F|nr:tRNA1(Val) (adenine(37)-N6)-methyltransferase [Anaerosalibacter massiliensis]
MEIEKDERIDIIPGSNLKIIQNKKKFSYGMDAVLLAGFSYVKRKDKVVDLGTGTGIIPLLLYSRYRPSKIYGLEIQSEMADMANRTVHLNKLEDKIEILNTDLKEISKVFDKNKFDIVISNPPYMNIGGGVINKENNFAISRHEIACTLEDIIKTSSFLLKNKGDFFLVHRPYRMADIICLLRKYNLEPKEIQFVHPKVGEKPNLLLLRSSKGGKPELKFKKPLYVYNEDCSYTDEIYKIYGIDKENINV